MDSNFHEHREGNSFGADSVITSEKDVVRINPHLLLERTTKAFKKYLGKLHSDSDEFDTFREILKKDYEAEVIRERR